MVYGIISDIHSNLEALELVLAELSGLDGYLCLGDIVGYGPDPNECVKRIARLPNCYCVVGNHDAAAVGKYDISWFNPHASKAILWTKDRLSKSAQKYLKGLPDTLTVGDATLVHGALPNPMDYVTSPWQARLMFGEMTTPLAFIGHSHICEYFVKKQDELNCRQIPLWEGGEVKLEDGSQYIINCGAVGQPRDGNPKASFGIYDTKAQVVTIKRIEYPVERVQKKMAEAGLPRILATRLAVGR